MYKTLNFYNNKGLLVRTFIFICTLISLNTYAITDSSLKDTDKYQILNIAPIQKSPTFKVMATFYPPIGKKLNDASFIKVWEKEKNEWITVDEIIPNKGLEFSGEYHLEKLITSKNKKSELAIEVEFIHCSHTGGQCAMERYIGKINRTDNSKEKNVILTLRI